MLNFFRNVNPCICIENPPNEIRAVEIISNIFFDRPSFDKSRQPRVTSISPFMIAFNVFALSGVTISKKDINGEKILQLLSIVIIIKNSAM